MTPKRTEPGAGPTLATNRSARHEFSLLERFEAGVCLTGPEVKSCRAGRVHLQDAYVKIQQGEAFLLNAHVSPYEGARHEEADPTRPRKLLLHAREILRLARESQVRGMTIVPTRMYLKNGRIKVEIALAKGKKTYDKREAARREQMEKDMRREAGARRGR